MVSNRTATGWRLVLPIALLALAGCDARHGAQDDGTMPQATVDSLMQEYPRLGAEPLPPPQPSPTANPGNLPDRLARAAPDKVLESVTGQATFYADHFEGQRTASGIPFRQNQLVAAHRGYPFGTIVRVTNLRNERSVNVRVVDRGPFGSHATAQNTIIDLSRRAAEQLAYTREGRARVQVEVLEWGSGLQT